MTLTGMPKSPQNEKRHKIKVSYFPKIHRGDTTILSLAVNCDRTRSFCVLNP